MRAALHQAQQQTSLRLAQREADVGGRQRRCKRRRCAKNKRHSSAARTSSRRHRIRAGPVSAPLVPSWVHRYGNWSNFALPAWTCRAMMRNGPGWRRRWKRPACSTPS